jgi:hypothetical protein
VPSIQTTSLPLDSRYCSRNVVSVCFTSVAVFYTFQPVYYSTDPYPHYRGTFGIALRQARVRCSLCSSGLQPLVRFCGIYEKEALFFVIDCQNKNIIVFARGRWCNFAASCTRSSRSFVPLEGHGAAYLINILSSSIFDGKNACQLRMRDH